MIIRINVTVSLLIKSKLRCNRAPSVICELISSNPHFFTDDIHRLKLFPRLLVVPLEQRQDRLRKLFIIFLEFYVVWVFHKRHAFKHWWGLQIVHMWKKPREGKVIETIKNVDGFIIEKLELTEDDVFDVFQFSFDSLLLEL